MWGEGRIRDADTQPTLVGLPLHLLTPPPVCVCVCVCVCACMHACVQVRVSLQPSLQHCKVQKHEEHTRYLESYLAMTTLFVAWPSASSLPSLGFIFPPCQAPLHLYLENLSLPHLLPQFREPRHPATQPRPQRWVNRKLGEGRKGVRKVPGQGAGGGVGGGGGVYP